MNKKSEATILREVQIAISTEGHRVFRNNIGVARDNTGSYIRYGVCNPGGSDLIGWTRCGKFLAVECKSEKGRLSKPQVRFLDCVKVAGGVAAWGSSIESIIKQINDQL